MGMRPLSLLVLTIAPLFSLSACQSEEEHSGMENLTDFATRYAAAWSSQNPEAFSLFYTENGSLQVNDGEPSIGRDAIAETARSFMEAYPDMVVRLVDLRQIDDHVEFHWHWTGTNTGPSGTGTAVDLRGYELWTLAKDGLIFESLGRYDEAEYERQLNAGPATSE
jgi:uncharacterized protein (TIGR02246 family)